MMISLCTIHRNLRIWKINKIKIQGKPATLDVKCNILTKKSLVFQKIWIFLISRCGFKAHQLFSCDSFVFNVGEAIIRLISRGYLYFKRLYILMCGFFLFFAFVSDLKKIPLPGRNFISTTQPGSLIRKWHEWMAWLIGIGIHLLIMNHNIFSKVLISSRKKW